MLEATSSKFEGDFPLGMKVRFIPCATDESIVISQQGRLMAQRARVKQQKFIKRTCIMSSEEIVGLDYVLPSKNISLRQALMALRSRSDPTRSLFLMVEEDWDDPGRVRFLHHESEEAECMEMIPALGLVMAKELGTPKAWTWFSKKMAEDCKGFEYDPAKGIYDPNDQQAVRDDELHCWDSLLGEDSDDEMIYPAGTSIIANPGRMSNLNFGSEKTNRYDDNGTLHSGGLRDMAGFLDDRSEDSSSKPTADSSNLPLVRTCWSQRSKA